MHEQYRERTLIQRIAQGDKNALVELDSLYHSNLLTFFRKLVVAQRGWDSVIEAEVLTGRTTKRIRHAAKQYLGSDPYDWILNMAAITWLQDARNRPALSFTPK